MAGDGDVVIKIKGDESDFKGKINGLGGIAQKGFAAIGTAIAAVGTGLVAAGTQAVKVGMSFEEAMSQVAATMGTTVDQIGDLAAAAKEMGATTQFTATQAAEALNYMALAGWDSEKSIAALPKVLNLAAAGGMELGYASDLVTDSMSALSMSIEELDGFIDQMSKTSQKSNTSVSQLGEAILTVGGTAKTLKGGITEMNTVLGLLADNGIKGAEGGTALRNMILSLSAPTDKAAKTLESLGVSTVDASGDLRSLQDIMGDLNAALAGMGSADKAGILNEIFNKVDLKSVNALLGTTTERWNELSAEIEDSAGSAAAQAKTLIDNLKGDITILQSALEGLGISVYESIQQPLREAAQWGIAAVDSLHSAFKESGFEGLFGAIGDVLADAITKITEYAPQLVEAASSVIQAFLQGLITNLPQIASGLAQLGSSMVTAIVEIVPLLVGAFMQLVAELSTAIAQELPALIPVIVDGVLALADAIISNLPALAEAGWALIDALGTGILAAIPDIVAALPTLIQGLLDYVLGAIPLMIDAGMKLFVSLIEALPDIISQIVAVLPELIRGIIGGLLGALPMLVQAGVQLFVALVEALPTIITEICKAIPEIIGGITAGFMDAIPAIIEAGVMLFKALVFDIPAIIAELVLAIPEIIAGLIAGFQNQSAMIADAGKQLFENFVVGASEVAENVAQFGQQIVEEGTAAFESFNALRLNVQETVSDSLSQAWQNIVAWGSDLVTKGQEVFQQFVEGAAEWFDQLPERLGYALGQAIGSIIQFGQDAWAFITTEIPAMIDSIGEFFAQLPGIIAEKLKTALDNIVQWGKDTIQSGKDTAKGFFENIVNTVKELPGKFKEFLTNVVKNVVDWGKNLIDSGKKTITDFIKNIVDGIKALPGKFAQMAKDAVDGFIQGIKNMWSSAKKAVDDFFRGLVDGIKATLGIRSPSRVLRDEVGKMMAQGVGVGWRDQFPEEYKKINASVMAEQQSLSAQVTGAAQGAVVTNSTSSSMRIEGGLHIHTDSLDTAQDFAAAGEALGEEFNRQARYKGVLVGAS